MSLGKRMVIVALVGLTLFASFVYLLNVALTTKHKGAFVASCVVFLVLAGLCLAFLGILWLRQPKHERDWGSGFARGIQIAAGLFAISFLVVCLALYFVLSATSIGIPFTAARGLYVVGFVMIVAGGFISAISEIRVD